MTLSSFKPATTDGLAEAVTVGQAPAAAAGLFQQARSAVHMPKSNKKDHPPWLGGASAMMAVCITHPIDQTKIRSQVQYPRRSMLATARNTIASSGAFGLWIGLSGSLLRNATYGAARFGVYDVLKNRALSRGVTPSTTELIGYGAIGGLVAGLMGAPAEVITVRLSADGVKPPEQRLRYRNCFEGLYRIVKEEGIRSSFRGLGPTMTRAVILNASQMTGYDRIKQRLLKSGYKDSVPIHLITATASGTIAVTLCAPVDVVKSRIQLSTKPGIDAFNLVRKSLQREGFSVLFRGWLPAWLRMVPNTCLTFMFFEQLKRHF